MQLFDINDMGIIPKMNEFINALAQYCSQFLTREQLENDTITFLDLKKLEKTLHDFKITYLYQLSGEHLKCIQLASKIVTYFIEQRGSSEKIKEKNENMNK